jgi:cytosine/adenosine deaminase-related metal-dependent hydrolase
VGARRRALAQHSVTQTVSADWVLPVEGPPIQDGAVVIEGGRIAAVGPAAELGQGARYEEAAIVPGFVNAHSHLEYAVYAGFGDGLSFGPWILLHIERKARLALEHMEAIARLGAAQCLASGISTVGDASFSGASAPACAALGLRAIVYLEVFGRGPEEIAGRFERNRERVADVLDDDVRLGISPHAPYTCSAELYAACLELGLPVATHLAESEAEQEWLASGTGPWEPFADLLEEPIGETGIRHLARHRALDERVTAAHCVMVDDEEIELLARHDVAVAHCPRSNALLGCGIAPLAELQAAGVRVGLGTDSPASAPSFDIFDELLAAVMAARARERRSDVLSAAAALELATLGSARALGLEQEVGSLRPGKRADLAVVWLGGSPYVPWEDPAAAVVFGGSPERVEATFVGGQVRYERGVFEWHDLHRSAASARALMLAPAP